MTKKLIKDSNNCIFNAAAIEGTSFSPKGVVLNGENNQLLHFIPETDPVKQSCILDELAELILAINNGENYTPQWPA